MSTSAHTAIKYILFGIFTILFGLIIWPFFPSIIFAIIFGIIFYPVMNFLTNKLRLHKGISALFTLILTVIFILTPIALLVGLITKEAIVFVQNFDQSAFFSYLDSLQDFEIFGYEFQIDQIKESLIGLITNAGNQIYSIGTSVGGALANFSFLFFVFLFLYYYFLKEGPEILEKIQGLLPFSKGQNELLMEETKRVSKAVFIGNLVGAVLSGVAAYIAFAFFQVPGAIIWGLLAGLLSLIPTIGALFVYIIAIVIVYFTGGLYFAIGLLAYFLIVEIFMLQNFIKPKMLDDKIAVHPILVFFALIGGVIVFKSMGIIYGPLIVVLFISMLDFIVGSESKA